MAETIPQIHLRPPRLLQPIHNLTAMSPTTRKTPTGVGGFSYNGRHCPFGGGMDDGFEGDDAQQGLPVPAIICIVVAALAAVTLVVVAVRRGAKKRKANQSWEDDDDWGDWGTTVPPLNEHVPVIPRGQNTIVRGNGASQPHVPGELNQTSGSQPGTGQPGTVQPGTVQPGTTGNASIRANDPSGASSHMRP